METISLSQNKNIVSLVTGYLNEGKVLVLPTDTVYGLICDATNKSAVEKIFEIKKRDKLKPLAVFVKDIEMAEEYAEVNDNQKEFLKKNWPGKITIILRQKKIFKKTEVGSLSSLVIGRDGTIALRIPGSEFLNGLLKEFKKPLAQTSANISGQPATTKIKEVLEKFINIEVQPDIVVDTGDLPKSKPSKIIDFTNNKINIVRQ